MGLSNHLPPWRQPRGKWMVSLVNSNTNATSNRLHLWEIDLSFALRSTPGWNVFGFVNQHDTTRIPGVYDSTRNSERLLTLAPAMTKTRNLGTSHGGDNVPRLIEPDNDCALVSLLMEEPLTLCSCNTTLKGLRILHQSQGRYLAASVLFVQRTLIFCSGRVVTRCREHPSQTD